MSCFSLTNLVNKIPNKTTTAVEVMLSLNFKTNVSKRGKLIAKCPIVRVHPKLTISQFIFQVRKI